MDFVKAPDIQVRLEKLVRLLEFGHINQFRVIAMRSHGSSARAYARAWSLPRIWQNALDVHPYYVIEVIAHYFDKLNHEDQDKVLIHELLHIPKTFSGALVPHTCFGKRIDDKAVNKLYDEYVRKLESEQSQ